MGVSSRFGVTLFPTIGRQTLIFINVTSFHLTSIDDLKGKKSSFILHSFSTHTLSFFYIEKSFIVNEMASPSSIGPNSLKSDSNSPSTNNAPPAIPPPLLPLHFPIFPLPPQVFLPKVREVQPWEASEEKEEENDLEEFQLKAKEDAEDASFNSLMRNVPRHKRKCIGSQTSFDLSMTASGPSNGSDSNLGRFDSSKGWNSRGEEEDEEEEDEKEVHAQGNNTINILVKQNTK